ncbi:MAG: toll/interleukin-1 receptor domain-containing protein [Flavobacteriales bacterium]|nr:toll/interleukin-1 receptor domain-containing protein [Flavobacteriales bacterium]
MMRDVIFISHANPEDNYFASWLASKLQVLGYSPWVDVKSIKPGEYFDREYEDIILNRAIKFLAVVSSNYLAKVRSNDTGVMNELLAARTIKNLDPFIVPLRLDNSSYADFPTGLRGRLAIDFSNNWATGINELLLALSDQGTPKTSGQPEQAAIFWHKAHTAGDIETTQPELHYTNWFPLHAPATVYAHRITETDKTGLRTQPFTYIEEGPYVISFASASALGPEVEIRSTREFTWDEFRQSATIALDPLFELIDPAKKLVKLINKTIHRHLLQQRLSRIEYASRKSIYFYPYTRENFKPVDLRLISSSRRSLLGRTSGFTWHFAISHNAILFPSPHVRIGYHLVFTDSQGRQIPKEQQATLRRSVPSSWFNRKWLEMLIAMMYKISGSNDEAMIRIPVAPGQSLDIDVLPIAALSDVGYKEPQNEARAASHT